MINKYFYKANIFIESEEEITLGGFNGKVGTVCKIGNKHELTGIIEDGGSTPSMGGFRQQIYYDNMKLIDISQRDDIQITDITKL
jgi:hypothetical protein